MSRERKKHFFKRGEVWETPYGAAKVVVTPGPDSAATFRVVTPTSEASRMGWRKGMTFLAHPDDMTSPSPKTWTRTAAGGRR